MGPCQSTEDALKMEPSITEQRLADQAKVADVDWEWIIIQITSLTNLPRERGAAASVKNADPDPYIHVTAFGEEPSTLKDLMDKHVNQYRFPVKWDNVNPTWNQVGMVAYVKGTAKEIRFDVKDKNHVLSDTALLSQVVPIPTPGGGWEETTMTASVSNGEKNKKDKDKDIQLVVRMMCSSTPVVTEEEQKAMGLQEEIFTLDSGDKASLVYKTNEGNRKAVFYFPGFYDSFAHPHVLEAFTSRNYDFYSLDPHGCGRTEKYLDNLYYGHSIKSFDHYEEDIDKALAFAKKQHGGEDYESIVVLAHSTGALTFMAYQMLKNHDTPFDACIFNGPFLDWGHVGGDMLEWVLEHTALISKVTFTENRIFREGKPISKWGTMNWLLYRWNLADRPLPLLHLTSDFCNSATTIQRKMMKGSKKEPILGDMPGLLLQSWGDDTINHAESLERIHCVFKDPTVVEFKNNHHDVVLSFTKEFNDDAIEAITTWLDKKGL